VPGTARPESRWKDGAIAAAVALVAALLPYHRALRFPFSLDDYTYLFQASGLDAAPFTVRRWLAVRGYFELALGLFGPSPVPWHIAGMALHVANAVWVFLLARRLGATRAAGWIACGLFACSPLAFTAVYWTACIQELGSCCFVLAAACLALRQDRWRWGSVPAFAAAMLCKESVVAAPLVFGAGAPGSFQCLLQAVDRGLPLPLRGTDAWRSVIFIRNFADLILRSVVHPQAGGRILLVSDYDVQVPALIARLAALMDRPERMWRCPRVLLGAAACVPVLGAPLRRLTRSLLIDSSSVRRALDWSPPVGLDEALAETVRGYLAARG